MPGLPDQRFGRDAYRVGAGCPNGRGLRRDGRYDDRADGSACESSPGAGRMQPLSQTRVPDRSSLHDASERLDSGGNRSKPAQIIKLDTRTKIVSTEEAVQIAASG